MDTLITLAQNNFQWFIPLVLCLGFIAWIATAPKRRQKKVDKTLKRHGIHEHMQRYE